MRRSLSTISTLNTSFAEDVAAYAEAGFEAIGLWEMKLPEDDADNVAQLRAAGLSVSNCVPSVPSFLQLAIPGMEGPSEPEERIEAILPALDEMIGGGLITLERARVIMYRPGTKSGIGSGR